MKVSDECLTSATLFSSAVRDAFFLFCTELDPTIALRVFVFEYDALRGPYLLPYYNGQSNISAFAVVSTTEKNLPVSDFLFMSMSDNTYGMTMGSNGLYSETVSYVMGDDTTPNNISPSPSLSPPNVDQPSGSGNGNGNGNGNRSGGIVGSIIAAICIIALLYCRFVRKRRVQSKINEIMQRHDGSTHVVPPDPRWATVSNIVPPPPPLPPPAHHFASFAAIPTEEQQDLAQIEMQRMRLGPTPSIVGSSAGVAPPIAPPSTVSISDDHYETSTPQSHSHQYLHPQHQHSTFNRHIASKSQGTDSGEDSYLQHTYSNSPSGSSTGPVASKDPVYPSYAGSGSEGSSYRHHHHPLQVSQSFSSPKEKDKGWADDDSENLSSSPPPPPPPYLAVATQLLNAPSAPSSSNPPPPQ
ncbi:hypothetical protein BC939DRAFT_176497 [Gamsiella multidivaricata]|uniref:uncharacterized protein n=1 Tax=Gamsiella multidivaricata TaxID=101098 RepID=UPI00221FC868|nr:uncharacterized protein BC939DRAFT_176497 [Gamsiella multidivaricata]KAI7822666.1 hypothetical protein BC939DRAFT_176497 [Gamsiella multidivaricata]